MIKVTKKNINDKSLSEIKFKKNVIEFECFEFTYDYNLIAIPKQVIKQIMVNVQQVINYNKQQKQRTKRESKMLD